MVKPRESRNLSISIDCALERAYDFLCVPENFPKWASGLAGTLTKTGGEWLAETPQGRVRIRFSERNTYGVLDHWVYPGAGVEVYVPMRTVANGDGCELILTLFRLPDMTDEKFAADAEWVRRDLTAVKNLLEKGDRLTAKSQGSVQTEEEAKMKTLHYMISIDAPKETVWNAMLGHEGFKAWTDEFAHGSDYEGSWEKGQRIRFLAGKAGMSSMIADNRPYEFISIKHLGYIKGGVEDTQSAEVKAWAPAFENYSFSEKNGKTEVKVDVEEIPQMEEFMEDVWPKALAKLKDICEHSVH